MNNQEANYWQNKVAASDVELDVAEVNFVRSFGATIFPDGDMFCCLLGENIQEGIAYFDKTAIGAARKMNEKLRFNPAQPPQKKG